MYDGDDVIFVFDDSSSLTNRYLHGDVVDQVFADETSSEVLWALTDNQGTVRDILNYDPTQDESTILNHRKFDAYGNITAESNGSIEFRYAYTGRYFDEDTGLQYNRARWYDAQVGRWISEDPIGFAAGVPNISRYVGNAPTNFTDPSGLVGIQPPKTASSPPGYVPQMIGLSGGRPVDNSQGFGSRLWDDFKGLARTQLKYAIDPFSFPKDIVGGSVDRFNRDWENLSELPTADRFTTSFVDAVGGPILGDNVANAWSAVDQNGRPLTGRLKRGA